MYKWLGHCWSKLADSKKAEQYFLEGVEFGKSKVMGGRGWRGARRERSPGVRSCAGEGQDEQEGGCCKCGFGGGAGRGSRIGQGRATCS